MAMPAMVRTVLLNLLEGRRGAASENLVERSLGVLKFDIYSYRHATDVYQ